jgi:hypothetical protein
MISPVAGYIPAATIDKLASHARTDASASKPASTISVETSANENREPKAEEAHETATQKPQEALHTLAVSNFPFDHPIKGSALHL